MALIWGSLEEGAERGTGVVRLALEVLRQAQDDQRFRPYDEDRHGCGSPSNGGCGQPPDTCAYRFMQNGANELWCDIAGISADRIRSRLRAMLALS